MVTYITWLVQGLLLVYSLKSESGTAIVRQFSLTISKCNQKFFSIFVLNSPTSRLRDRLYLFVTKIQIIIDTGSLVRYIPEKWFTVHLNDFFKDCSA